VSPQIAGPAPDARAAGTPILAALTQLAERLASATLPLDLPDAAEARASLRDARAQLDDYILPRYRRLDAPLLAVVGGSTGAGKSTLVNSLVGQVVSRSGAIRPTTRDPVLVHHPDDAPWFADQRILPDLPRLHGQPPARGRREASGGGPSGTVQVPTGPAGTAPGRPGPEAGTGAAGLVLAPVPALPPGLALLDAPDVDSVVDANRLLAGQLLAAADLWVFVTSANRYADAVPWALLRAAAERDAEVAVVLDRVPPRVADEVRGDLRRMLDSEGLAGAPLFTVLESDVHPDGLLPAAAVGEVGAWLEALARDAAARAGVVRRTLHGAVGALAARVEAVADAADRQVDGARRLRAAVDQAYADAVDAVVAATEDGSMLRGEILARWQEFVGTGELLRGLQGRVGALRDRVSAFVRGRPQPVEGVVVAIEHGLASLLRTQADAAAERAQANLEAHAAGRALLAGRDVGRASDDFGEVAAREIRRWQDAVLDLVRTEGQQRRTTARFLAFGLNGIGVTLMIVAFASTGGLVGAEIGIAGGTAVLAQKLLEAVFGDQAVRTLAREARADLRRRCEILLAAERARFLAILDAAGVDPDAGEALRAAAARARAALAEDSLAEEPRAGEGSLAEAALTGEFGTGESGAGESGPESRGAATHRAESRAVKSRAVTSGAESRAQEPRAGHVREAAR
jgi:hypothetical protein